MDKDVRTLPVGEFQTRDASAGSSGVGVIEGYAAVFNKPSLDMGFTEFMDPKAFDGVNMNETVALYNHNYDNVLGRVSAGTLTLKTDDKGLAFTLTVPDTSVGRDVYENAKNGNLKGCSFGFTIADNGDTWERTEDGNLVHTILQIKDLYEISIVTMPAYNETSIKVTRGRENKDAEARKRARLQLEIMEGDY